MDQLKLSLRKMSHNLSSDTCKWIPLPPLNKEWTDEEVYKYFKLSEEEIENEIEKLRADIQPEIGFI